MSEVSDPARREAPHADGRAPVIELCRVRKTFRDPAGREVEALAGVDLALARGETVCLIGPSGCGKTTLLRTINRLVEPSAGTIRVEGRDVRSFEPIRLRRRIGLVVQEGGLFPHLNVARNVGLLCELEGWPIERTRARVRELLELVNLDPREFARRHPNEISGGQRQRVGVARALALDPEMILMDEPFGALDPITRSRIQGEFARLESIVRKTILMVTHDLDEAFLLGDRVALMDRGRIVQVGGETELRERPASPFVERFLRQQLPEGG